MFAKLVKLKAKKKRGFTLIELIVVIAILGVLAAILVPSMMGFVSNARESAADANARTAYVAAQSYITQQISRAAAAPAAADITVANLGTFLGSTFTGSIVATLDASGNVSAIVWTGADGTTGYYPANTRP